MTSIVDRRAILYGTPADPRTTARERNPRTAEQTGRGGETFPDGTRPALHSIGKPPGPLTRPAGGLTNCLNNETVRGADGRDEGRDATCIRLRPPGLRAPDISPRPNDPIGAHACRTLMRYGTTACPKRFRGEPAGFSRLLYSFGHA